MQEEEKRQVEDEMNWGNLIKSPIRLFGLVYPYFIVLLVAGGLVWVLKLDSSYVNSIKPIELKRDTAVPEIAMKKPTDQAGVDLKLLLNPTDEIKTKGADLFKSNCASCHGAEGKGDGIAGASLNPKPRNFTEDKDWVNGRNFGDMFKTLEEGVTGSGMVSYNYMPVMDRVSLIYYIRTTFMKDAPKVTEDEIAKLDEQYSLTQGKVAAGEMPVDMAIDKIVDENKMSVEKVADIESKIKQDMSANGKLFENITKNKERAIYTLMKDPAWQNDEMQFVKIVGSDIDVNGFKPDVLRLSKSEIASLQSYLKGYFNN